MLLCEAPPLMLFGYGELAVTTRSMPSLLAVPAYLLVCLALCIRRRALGWIDPIIVGGLVTLQLSVLGTTTVLGGSTGLAGYALLAPFMAFLVGYGGWRLAGGRPLANWPWPRFGLLVTLTLLLTDVGMALTTPAPPGRVWQLGGACLRDALFLGPPFLTVVFYGLLDCRSSWVFCSPRCVGLGRCRFGLDGKAGGCADDGDRRGGAGRTITDCCGRQGHRQHDAATRPPDP